MEHIAIMRKSWGLIPKILKDQKKIESRWYKIKYAPWDKIKKEETVYFKDAGEPVTIKAEVEKVLQYSDLTPAKVKKILFKYGPNDGLGIDEIPGFYELFKEKRYCILIFLKNPRKIKPFDIDKTSFGAMSAWISVDDVDKIKI